MEGELTAHPILRSALVAGYGKFKSSLLIEPREYPRSDEARVRLLGELWSTLVQANRHCLAHGRVMKDFIMLTTQENQR